MRGSKSSAIITAAVAGTWLAGAFATGELLTAPFDIAVDALRGESGSFSATVKLVLLASVALAFWTLAAIRMPDERPTRACARVLMPICGGPGFASALVAVKQLGRRPELRRTVGGAGVAAVAGAALFGYGLGGGNDLSFILAAGAALLGCAVIPIAAYGIRQESAWLFDVAPGKKLKRDVAAAFAAFVLAFAVLVIELGLIWLAAPVIWSQVVPILGAAFVLFGAGLVIGAIVPWRSDRIIEQLAAFMALAVLAFLFQLSLGEVVSRSESAGVPTVVITALALAVPPALGLSASAVAAHARVDR